ncbi:MAG: hypothetical protein H0T89_20885 [Deltaproteobacteria bacterium]|nr:hypothetical protein [Deltaproteobacteria bacterium]MDQ3301358.1 hypothetical protein [Myxococcota bacterium]
MRRSKSGAISVAIAALGIGLPAFAVADDLPPLMDHDSPVLCARDKEGQLWRIQCNPATKICLYAANNELDESGNRVKSLERARECAMDMAVDREKLEAAGFKMVSGRPDVPFGWTRDERGRVFQVNFDLKRRMYFGAAYTPKKILENPLESSRTSIDFGLLIFHLKSDGETPTVHRFRFVEGQVHLEPFSAELVIAHYDVSRRFLDPLLRITTFVGQPQRHDLKLNLGLWTEAGGLEIHRTSAGYSQLWKHATAQVTLDLWQSPILDSFIRLRTGIGLEGQRDEVNGYRSGLTASSALEMDFVLDPNGFHNFRLELAHEVPRYFVPVNSTSNYSQRLRAKVQYEAIVLAINDQPLTLKLAAGGEKRDDIPGVPHQWAFVMDAGLRFSLWAPPRPRS